MRTLPPIRVSPRALSYQQQNSVSPTNLTSPTDKLDLILQEIRDLRTAIDYCIDIIATDLGMLRDDHQKLADKVHSAKSTLIERVPQHTLNTSVISDLQRQLQALHDRAEEAEGCEDSLDARVPHLEIIHEDRSLFLDTSEAATDLLERQNPVACHQAIMEGTQKVNPKVIRQRKWQPKRLTIAMPLCRQA
ncbi:hypothetical protein NDU88_004745 [Pleurodeles waltl]|uniref:Uncharacterized protein n=1 Tax=Pleurodeles waltl TaxID=8319 RepID=A0AAV7M770_PLEWA|nr:hypothetical protein NDU88_004745 [Pleurodeles waltl]